MRHCLINLIKGLMILSILIIAAGLLCFAFSVANVCQGKARPIDIAMIWIYATAFVVLFVPLLFGINPFNGDNAASEI